MLEQASSSSCAHVLKACKTPFSLEPDVFREIIDIIKLSAIRSSLKRFML